MKRLSSFSNFSLTKSEMQGVKGGACAVCSQGSGGGGTCGSYTFTESEASGMASGFNSKNPDPSNPYYYYYRCI